MKTIYRVTIPSKEKRAAMFVAMVIVMAFLAGVLVGQLITWRTV